jgi:protocatechuate 3,4-dioxygenase beta subunit
MSGRSKALAAMAVLSALAMGACGPEFSATASPVAQDSPGEVAYPTSAPGMASREVDIAPTLGCAARGATPQNTEGPYYKAGSPERASLVETGMSGDRLVVEGTVFSTVCIPIAGAWLDFWQADAAGQYDNAGYRLRGHQFTGEAGRFRLDTILPAPYGSRPGHIHVKVQAPGGRSLTTQLYFPEDPLAAGDAFFDFALTVVLEQVGDGYQATFDFVLDLPAP